MIRRARAPGKTSAWRDRVEADVDLVEANAGPAPQAEAGLDRRRMNLVFVTVVLGMLLAALCRAAAPGAWR